jgi:hypothetical protein
VATRRIFTKTKIESTQRIRKNYSRLKIMAFPTIDSALQMVKLQSGIAESDESRDDYILDILEQSKGTIDGVIEYRPYLVAALTMWTSKGEQTITEASGSAKFRYQEDKMNLRPAIEGNLRIQQSLDISQGTDVPVGWGVQTWLDSLCGCVDKGQSVGNDESNYVFSTMVI